MSRVYTKDHINEKLANTINQHTRQLKAMRTDQTVWGLGIPKFSSDPTVPSSLSGQIFLYWNTANSVFRKYTGGAWSNL